MTQRTLFSSGMELAPFVTSSGLLCRSWDVISSRCAGIISNVGVGLSWKVYKEPEKDLTIIAFEATPDSSNLKDDLVSSSDLREKNFLHFDFLCSKSNPLFSVNSTAVSLFYENHQRLDQLKSEFNSSPQVIVTGHALGGAIASLFTLSLLDGIGSGKKSPLCITFGSPLLGDKRLQQAISRSSTWNSCFLHVVPHKDPLPRLFITNPTSAYMPFGTFLLCSDIYSTCFEDPDFILTLLEGSIHDQSQVFQSVDYGNIVESLYRRAICMDLTAQTEDMTHSNSLHASISLQLWSLGLTPHMQQQQKNIDINTLVTKMEKKFIFQKWVPFDPSKKLAHMKMAMAQLEWYKKDSKNRDIGYYDSYKKMSSTIDVQVVDFHQKLTIYWERMVKEAEINPQKEGAAFRIGWLIAGTSYRRMVEPLDIAKYYRDGGKDYVTKGRSKHFKQLEYWLMEETKGTSSSNNTSTKNVESILTFDSCFWAHVEEAILSCKQLNNVESSVTEKEEASRKLLEFEEYVYGLLKNYAVSPEIFLKGSSFMRWWNLYKAIKGTSYNSALARLMHNANYE